MWVWKGKKKPQTLSGDTFFILGTNGKDMQAEFIFSHSRIQL